MIGRAAAISLAVLACAWFALGTRQAQDTSRATAIVGNAGTLTAAQAKRADSLLSSASTLNPDRQVDLLRGIVALDRNQRSRAIGIFESLARAEPQNINAWVYLAQAGLGNDRLVNRAVARIAVLDPGPNHHH